MARILIIDDSMIIREMLLELLGDMGHDVQAATQGEDGISRALKDDFDLVICDLHLPTKNGLQVFQAVHEVKPDLMFMFTDSLPDELGKLARETTGQAYLRKPFDIYQLREKLESLLQSIKTE